MNSFYSTGRRYHEPDSILLEAVELVSIQDIVFPDHPLFEAEVNTIAAQPTEDCLIQLRWDSAFHEVSEAVAPGQH